MSDSSTTAAETAEMMPAAEQLEQLLWYFSEHYPAPDFTPPWQGGRTDPADAERWVSHIVDRTTHAAILQLGTAVDHRMPQVAWTDQVELTPLGSHTLITTDNPSSTAILSVHGGSGFFGGGAFRDVYWQPLVAALAQRSGARVIDVHYPLHPAEPTAARTAVREARSAAQQLQGVDRVIGFGDGYGAALLGALASEFDGLILRNPQLGGGAETVELPNAETWPRTLIQEFSHSSWADEGALGELSEAQTVRYYAADYLATPQQARQLIEDAADFCR
ncbi:alpha/beta hydrolase fold domain-containing protein [Corynebacterium sp. 11A]|uniref:alpha/beta hydrolase fold domain-containing protein n=1 Tax=Corynebacterium sp. 11A TaxID=2080510 RepID=UPI00124E9F5B|nr:alpha/beta hydrolase fold domain-containing protein [Corynebacterium sp. 11A]